MVHSSNNQEQLRELGQRLATFVRASASTSVGSNALLGAISDLVAEHPDLGPPLRDLVTRPAFQDLSRFAAQGGSGAFVQRDALVSEFTRTYQPDVVLAIATVLNGFLEPPSEASSTFRSESVRSSSFPSSAHQDSGQQRLVSVHEQASDQHTSVDGSVGQQAVSGIEGSNVSNGFAEWAEQAEDFSTTSGNRSNQSQKSSQPAQQNINSASSAGSTSTAPSKGNTILGFLVLATLTGVGILAAINEESAVVETQQNLGLAAISNLDSLQNELDQAVLMCEIKPLMRRIEAVATEGNQAADQRKRGMLAAANRQLASLDQPGSVKYWENDQCSWGHQWFDVHADNGFRTFVAVSRKCKNPRLSYYYSSDKAAKAILGKSSLGLAGHVTGTIVIPYYVEGYHYLNLDSLECGAS